MKRGKNMKIHELKIWEDFAGAVSRWTEWQ